jgi:integrase
MARITPDNVNAFISEQQARVRSVTVWNSVYKLRRAAQLIAPDADFCWLTEIEKDVALVMMPRSKADRLVLTERLVEAGLTLIREAEMFGKTELARAVGVRNGLLIVLLALHPIRIKNFAALTIADTFININDRWWLHIPSEDTKSHRVDERQVPEFVTDTVNSYVKTHRAVLCRGDAENRAVWVCSTTGRQLTTKNLGTLISKLTRETIGVDVSPHLFRTAGASTAAVYGGITRTSPARFSITATGASPRNTTTAQQLLARAMSTPSSPSSTVSTNLTTEIVAQCSKQSRA